MAFHLRNCLAALSVFAAACAGPVANESESNAEAAAALPADNVAVAAANDVAPPAGGPCPVQMRGFTIATARSEGMPDEWDVTARWEMGPDAHRRYAEPSVSEEPPFYVVDHRPGTMDTPADAEAGWMPSVSSFTYNPAFTHIVIRCMGAEVTRLAIPRP